VKVIHKSNGVIYMTSPNITTAHAFTTRVGGVSSGLYESLNLAQGTEDCFDNVKENYSRLCDALGISLEDIVCSTQVHGTRVRVVTRDDCGKLFKSNPQNADALITNIPEIALLVFIADCVPILLYDPVKRVAGAVHAGWRGTAENIAGTAVQKMISEFGCSPSVIHAAIGPCISSCCYETDANVADAIKEMLGDNSKQCLSQKGNKYNVDLKETNRILLKNAEIVNISISDECTSCSSDKYWSHRKTQGKRGSQVAVIMIKD
jgi:hypothetical protein